MTTIKVGQPRILAEAVPPGYPVIHSFQPDLEAFYEKWLGRPLNP